MEAQRFPEDYNGILAGAPANYWTHLLASTLWDAQSTTLDPESYTIFSALYGSPNILEHYRRWLDLHRDMYTLWHPLYSFNDTDDAIPGTARVTILAGGLEWLYEINLFSPPLVEILGREHLLSIPAWLVKELEDGSIFYVPELTYNGGNEEDYAYTREEIAPQLGLRADEFEGDYEEEE